MNPTIVRHLSCSMKAMLRPVSSDATAIPIDFVMSIPTLGFDLVVSALASKESLGTSKDPERHIIELGHTTLHHALGAVFKGANVPRLQSSEVDTGIIPAEGQRYVRADEPNPRVAELEAQLADLTARYDALALGQMGILHDPR